MPLADFFRCMLSLTARVFTVSLKVCVLPVRQGLHVYACCMLEKIAVECYNFFMFTYVFRDNKIPLYEQLASFIRADIEAGVIAADEKLPSKRSLAKNLGVSVITVEGAYSQLLGEGYIYARERQGYFATDIRSYLPAEQGAFPDPAEQMSAGSSGSERQGKSSRSERLGGLEAPVMLEEPTSPEIRWDLSGNRVSPEHFPFSVWTRLIRRSLSEEQRELVTPSFPTGVRVLREAIAGHLSSFRGLRVSPDQIVVGAGTEYLYGLILQLIGRDKIFCLENPGYKKAAQIYDMSGAVCRFAGMDEQGILPEELDLAKADVAHISPNHHFPTGITMPVRRRREILQWAGEKPGRYVIEDDYDSEFRLSGKPIPPLFAIDRNEKVIYINTFSKSLSPTIRVSYMILPVHLAELFRQKLMFYSCTVPNLVQYTLAAFLSEGYFERHINRMRHFYAGKRREVLQCFSDSGLADHAEVQEETSGLHFTLRFRTSLSDQELAEAFLRRGIRMTPLSAYDHLGENPATHIFILNYSHVDTETLTEGFREIRRVLLETAGELQEDRKKR